MAAGYALGEIVTRDEETRRRELTRIGGALVLLFLVVGGLNVHADPKPWTVQPTVGLAVLSLLKCSNYPPSLQYLAMTLGPALLLLSALDRPLGPFLRKAALGRSRSYV
jgi:uncharacterized membrane protein